MLYPLRQPHLDKGILCLYFFFKSTKPLCRGKWPTFISADVNWVGCAKFFGHLKPYDFSKVGDQIVSGVAISGHSERFLPGRNGFQVECPGGLFQSTSGTLEPLRPGKILSEWPKIATALLFSPNFWLIIGPWISKKSPLAIGHPFYYCSVCLYQKKVLGYASLKKSI